MSANSEPYREPLVNIDESDGVLNLMTDAEHNELLTYLLQRLESDRTARNDRISRYVSIDKAISTWMQLSAEESAAASSEEVSGRSQMIPMNLPVMAVNLDDSVSFYTELFAPQAKSFYSLPKKEMSEPAKQLAELMNQDTKSRRYYTEIAMTFRALLKYNTGGLHVRWEEGGGIGELNAKGNRHEALDMYNTMWDQSVRDVSRICSEAEWAARVTQKNRVWLVKEARRGNLQRVMRVLTDSNVGEAAARFSEKDKHVKFYRSPPHEAGLGQDAYKDGRMGHSGGMNWDSYGAAQVSDAGEKINGYELVEMYCRLNPAEFGLITTKEGKDDQNPYALWRFIILDGTQVCFAQAVSDESKDNEEIPLYLGHLIKDDTRQAQRSQMEYQRPFQRFQSFLMNIYIASARKNIWGLKVYDPSAINITDKNRGDVAGLIPTKAAGRDVRTVIGNVDSSTGTEKVFEAMNAVEAILQRMFPNQALPNQVAGLDRAVRNQVTALIQGSVRRLHMMARIIDSDLFAPARTEAYRNLALHDSAGLDDLKEEEVGLILASGLGQMNADVIYAEIREMIMSILGSPESAAQFDLPGLFTYMGNFINSPSELGQFVKAVNPATPAPDQQLPGATAIQPTPGAIPLA